MEIELFNGSRAFNAELSVDPETGEISTQGLDLLVQRNPIGTCAFILNSNANAEMIKNHIKDMQAKLKSIENNAERATQALKYVMQQTNTVKVESTDKTFKAVLSTGRDCSVDIYEADEIPEEMQKTIPASYPPDKAKIKKALLDGQDVPGAKLVYNDRLTIS